VKFALSSGNQNQKLESVMAKPLKDQAFASPDKVAELVQKVCHEVLLIYDISIKKLFVAIR
jgi:hypothetical protein